VPAVTFYYDVGSPYAWLAAERIDGLFDAPVAWVPVLLGGIFRARGRSSWGLGEGRADGMAEVEGRARARGLPPVRWPEPWPNDGLRAMRAVVHAGTPFARAAFRVHFVEGRALSDEAAIALAAERAGLDPAAVLAATDDPEVKAELRANTDRALAAGAMGVPTVTVGDALFWGDDRLEEAAARA
jgi:2-hydroxychromene-2-carboxylate isomerase